MRRGGVLSQRGLTFVEMIATAAILLILASAILPMAKTMHKRNKELDLRRALRQMRTAIDEYHKCVPATGGMAGAGLGGVPAAMPGAPQGAGSVPCSRRISPLENKLGMEGYPEKLESLVEGVHGEGATDIKVKFLRRIPIDPMTNSTEWGLRCYQDEPDSTSWCGKNVYDVYTKSEGRALDDTPYREW
jgi:general secretion pathway protein G